MSSLVIILIFFCHIRPKCPKLRSLSTSKVRPPFRKLISSKTTHICHQCGASGHTHPDCFNLHDLFLNDDDDIQDAYCKLYNFCMKSLECSTKLKANFKKVKLERDKLIAKLDETNNLNEKFKNKISS